MEDKMKVKVFELMMLVSASLPTFGQNVLTVEANAMRDSDKLVYQQMESCYPGGTGKGKFGILVQLLILKAHAK